MQPAVDLDTPYGPFQLYPNPGAAKYAYIQQYGPPWEFVWDVIWVDRTGALQQRLDRAE